jgi:hypothetical protein
MNKQVKANRTEGLLELHLHVTVLRAGMNNFIAPSDDTQCEMGDSPRVITGRNAAVGLVRPSRRSRSGGRICPSQRISLIASTKAHPPVGEYESKLN